MRYGGHENVTLHQSILIIGASAKLVIRIHINMAVYKHYPKKAFHYRPWPYFCDFVSAKDWREPARLSSLRPSRFPRVPRFPRLSPCLLRVPKVSTLNMK